MRAAANRVGGPLNPRTNPSDAGCSSQGALGSRSFGPVSTLALELRAPTNERAQRRLDALRSTSLRGVPDTLGSARRAGKRRQALSFFAASVIAGTIWKRSPTMPYVATLKIGASGSLLIATMTFDEPIPARCWIAPETPHAM